MPTRDEITAAEHRFARSKQAIRDDTEHLRRAVRSLIAKPSSLAIAAGTAAILGFLLVRRPQAAAPPSKKAQQPSQLKALVTAYLLRAGRQRLFHLVQTMSRTAPRHPTSHHQPSPPPQGWETPGYRAAQQSLQ